MPGRTPNPNRDETDTREPLSMSLAKQAVKRVRIDWPAPRGVWSPETISSYDAFQTDVTAQAVRGVDLAAVMRYFDLLELQSRIFEQLMDEAMTFETASGPKSNPLISSLAQIVRTSLALAQHIGATPMSRVKLGLVNAEGALLQRALEDELGGSLEEMEAKIVENNMAARVSADDDVVDAEIVEEW